MGLQHPLSLLAVYTLELECKMKISKSAGYSDTSKFISLLGKGDLFILKEMGSCLSLEDI